MSSPLTSHISKHPPSLSKAIVTSQESSANNPHFQKMPELSLFQPTTENYKQSQKQQSGKTIWVENKILNPEAPENIRRTYTRETLNGLAHGNGTLTFPDGAKYVGGFKDGKIDGNGTYTFRNGAKYVGEFKDGKIDGNGTYTFRNGAKYVGEFKDGKVNGDGTLAFANGAKYVGEFKDGKIDGNGTYTYADGAKYVVEFKDGKKNGNGTVTYADGAKYVGEFKDGKKNGNGTYTYADGEKYVGEFKDGKYHGYGTLTNPSDIVLHKGRWINEEFNQSEEIPEELTLKINNINKQVIPEIDKLCKKAQEKAKEAYLKVQSNIYRPYFDAAIPGLPNVLKDIIATYAAPDYIGDDKDWNIEKAEIEKVGVKEVSFFSKISNFFSRKK